LPDILRLKIALSSHRKNVVNFLEALLPAFGSSISLRPYLSLTALVCCQLAYAELNELPVTFDLDVDPAGVAVQFDVSSEVSIESIGSPQFAGTSDHDVKSATLSSGVHRFIVYSLTGNSISPTGKVTVVFKPTISIRDGAIAIANVTASDENGEVVAAQPNSYPILTRTRKDHQSIDANSSALFPKLAVDLDGAIKSLTLNVDDVEIDSSSIAPFTLSWGPMSLGSYALSLIATDDRDKVATLDLGIFRAFDESEITDYSSFAGVHFGDGAANDVRGFGEDPYGSGFANGLAFFLGLNPHAPNSGRMPKVRLENAGEGTELVIEFVRRSELAGVSWSAQSSNDLSVFNLLTPTNLTETDQGDGSHAVEFRIQIDTGSSSSQFVNIAVSAP
jgi:hypothetical protein